MVPDNISRCPVGSAPVCAYISTPIVFHIYGKCFMEIRFVSLGLYAIKVQ